MSGPRESAHGEVGDVVLVGGGDAGLMSALILKELNPGVDLTVVDDFDEPIPEVGKSSITYILHTLHDVLGIDVDRFVSEVRPVWKASVYFEDWCGRGPFHVPFDGFTLQPSNPGDRRFEVLYDRYETGNYRTLGVEIAERGASPVIREDYYQRRIGGHTLYDQVAYHLSSDRLNEFLRDVCVERGIDLVNDTITDVRTDDAGIERVAGGGGEYGADLYVDATGFDRLLMGQLGNEFHRFDFPLDAALVAKADRPLSDVVPATVVKSGDHGWFWQIDTFDDRDMGYVYSSDHVTESDARAEFIAEKDGVDPDSDIRRYSFDTGHYERAWVGNCVAVGNALGFVEPLQSTALTLNAKLAEKLSELLADHRRLNHRGVRDIYNALARSIWDNVYDFISVHYRYASGDNEFWTAMRSVNKPERLDRYVANYRANGFNSYGEFDTRDGPTLSIFNQYLFYKLLRSLGVGSDFYEGLDVDVSPDVKANVERNDERIASRVDHHLSYGEVYGEVE